MRWSRRWPRAGLDRAAGLRHQPQGPGRGGDCSTRAAGRGAARRSSSTPPASRSPRRAARAADGPFAARDCPVLQVVFAGGDEAAWRAGTRGLPRPRPRDERGAAGDRRPHPGARGLVQGRGAARPADRGRPRRLSAGAPTASPSSPSSRATGRGCARTPPAERRVALVLANYPNRDGRIGNGVGLDTPASAVAVLRALARRRLPRRRHPGGRRRADRAAARGPDQRAAHRARRRSTRRLPARDYRLLLRQRCRARCSERVAERWGAPERDPFFRRAARLRPLRRSRLPLRQCRGRASSRRAATTSIRRRATTIRIWCRRTAISPSMPGCADGFARPRGRSTSASTAISNGCRARRWRCRPTAFRRRRSGRCRISIRSSSTIPARARQAKRRAQAVIVDHLTPPLTRAESYGPLRRAGAAGRRILRGGRRRSAPRCGLLRRRDPGAAPRHRPRPRLRHRRATTTADDGAAQARRLSLRAEGAADPRRAACLRRARPRASS